MGNVTVTYEVDPTSGAVAGFTTERLVGRRLRPSDDRTLRGLHADPEVMAHLNGVRDAAGSDLWLRRNLDHWEQEGFGQWLLADADGFVGRGGLRRMDPRIDDRLIEVGYVLVREAWGKGYATEATDAFIEIARDHLGLDQLAAIAAVDNVRSQRVLDRCGFTFERIVAHDWGPHRFYRRRL